MHTGARKLALHVSNIIDPIMIANPWIKCSMGVVPWRDDTNIDGNNAFCYLLFPLVFHARSTRHKWQSVSQYVRYCSLLAIIIPCRLVVYIQFKIMGFIRYVVYCVAKVPLCYYYYPSLLIYLHQHQALMLYSLLQLDYCTPSLSMYRSSKCQALHH